MSVAYVEVQVSLLDTVTVTATCLMSVVYVVGQVFQMETVTVTETS